MSSTKKNKLNFINALNICLVFAIILGGFYYLKSIDDIVNKNFELQNLKEKSAMLSEELSDYESVKNELESYENINGRIKDLKMVKVNDVSYITINDNSLAKK
jgi:cell shape-determining protein MreC